MRRTLRNLILDFYLITNTAAFWILIAVASIGGCMAGTLGR